MKSVRMGIIGLGNMGSAHAKHILDGEIRRCELAAVCDVDGARTARYAGKAEIFADSRELIRSGKVDAVLIATPHYQHTTVGADALKNGLHVLVEKPISVHKADCERLIAAHKGGKQVFAAMFNQRTDPHFKQLKKLLDNGELGGLVRVNWIITTWFRSEAYYASGGWRATWAGEGGGVLLNQCPHQLDLLCWLFGAPKRVTGFCSMGKYHDIEVEDEVTACLEYPNGATGVFITSTGELPGTNRLEVVGQRGRVVIEDDAVRFIRNEVPSDVYCRTTAEKFQKPETWKIDIPAQGHGGQHVEVKQNFIDAILDGKPLIAPAREGINSVELGNAMLMSSLLGKPVDMPLDGAAFERRLKKLIRESRFVKNAGKESGPADMAGSFR
ncbi:MAG: Gfo/Idh/MocA family oxidoreductase [Lentisphaerae bacterium]|nr:Gfo/Idh/MocA family oxidoreductase [Lentisphaerota bacterium]